MMHVVSGRELVFDGRGVGVERHVDQAGSRPLQRVTNLQLLFLAIHQSLFLVRIDVGRLRIRLRE
jgi:hypothetical protein